MKVALVLLGALLSYVAVCWVAAFVWNAVRHGVRLLVAWAARAVRWRRRWRRFMAQYGPEFAAPQYAWPACAGPRSGPLGAGTAALRVRRRRRDGAAHRWSPRPGHVRGGGPC